MILEKVAIGMQGLCAAYVIWMGYRAPSTQQKTQDFIVAAMLVCSVVFFLWKLFKRPPPPPAVPPPATESGQPHKGFIYIGPSGIPVSIENGKMKVDLKVFSCAAVRLLHVKIYVGGSPPIATLSDGEPDEIMAGDAFTKTLEKKLESGTRQLLALQYNPVHVQGTAKFGEGTDDQTFHFDAVPLFVGRD